MANFNVSTQSQLQSALSSANGGDTIVLANGSYGELILSKDYSSFVTIKAANPKGAEFSGVTFSGASNIRLDGVKVKAKTLSVLDFSHHISIENSEISGNGQFGLRAKDVSELTFKNNYVHDVQFGVAFFGVKGLTVTGNTVDHTESDGYKYGGVSDFLIENNRHGGHIDAASYGHSDFMQFLGSMNDGVVRGNVYLGQTRPNVQGLFFTGQASHHNVLIEQNIIYTGMANGITMPTGSGITVRNNTVLTIPNTVSATFIDVPGGAVSNNINTVPPGGLAGSNLRVQYSNSGGAYHYSDYFVNAMEGLGITLADLKPVAGSLATTKGAYARLMELLGGVVPDPEPEPDTNTAPDAIGDSAVTDAGKAVIIKVLANDTDADGDALSLVSVGNAANGTVTKNADGTVTYTPKAGFSGTDSFSYTISDGKLSDSATVKVTVNGSDPEPTPDPDPDTNTKPDAVADSATTAAGQAVVIKVLANDTDADGDALSVTWAGQSGHGTVTRNADGTITYKPNAGFSGSDSFYYTISDGELTDTAIVRISVDGSEPTPDPVPSGELLYAKLGSQSFSGSAGDVIELAHSAAFEVPAATIAFSFKADSVSGMQGLVSKDAYAYTGGGNHFTTYIESGTLYVRFQDGSADKVFELGGIKAGTEYDLQASFGGGKVSAWLDGKLIGQAAFTTTWEKNVEALQIGANGWTSATGEKGFTGPFDGTISDVRIAEGVRSLSEMAALAGSAAEPLPEPEPTPEPTPDPEPTPTPTPEPELDALYARAGTQSFSGAAADVIEVAHSAAFEVPEATIGFSFKADSVSGMHGLLSKDASGYAGGGNHFTAYIEDGTLYVRFQDGSADKLFELGGIKAGTEYDFQASFGEGKVAAWLDGQRIGEAAFATSWEKNVEVMQIGANGWTSESGEKGFIGAFDGTITDVLILDEAMTASEFAAVTAPAAETTSTSLLLAYSDEDGGGALL
ncbi:MAG TPA: Ig-like domain-containing protein [Paracoccaceae bacterium]|nr:Ig-like domain-containing protein [Paracoccaceae bacterium]